MTQYASFDRQSNAARFGRVAVVMGGDSAEREVSLNSGAGVLAALQSVGVDAFGVDGIASLLQAIQAGSVDRVFNILHGRGGEDGVLQGLLSALGVPYTGSGVLGSALSMDKVRSKQVWQALGLPTPAFAVLRAGQDVGTVIAQIGLPVVVKPSREGSSVGITRVRDAADLAAAIALAARYDGELLIERLIEGDELTVGVLGAQILPSIRIVPAGEYYDYHAKYVADDTRYLCPGLNDEAAELAPRELAPRLRSAGLFMMGPRGCDARPCGQQLAAGSEYRARHDLALLGAKGWRSGRYQLSTGLPAGSFADSG